MTKWINQVAIQAPRNGTSTHTVGPASGVVGGGTLFTPTAGRLLVCVCEASVTSTTPTGWTLPANGSHVNNTGLYVWYRTATGSDTFTTTHNAGDYPAVFHFMEFAAGATFVSAAKASVTISNGAGGATLSGLTGTNLIIGLMGSSNTAGAANSVTWDSGVEAIDTYAAGTTTPGYNYSATYLEDSVLTSKQFAATSTYVGDQESVVFAIDPAGTTALAANAGADQSAVVAGATVTLNGSGSTAGTGNTLAGYTWTQTSGTTVTLSGTGASRTYTAPSVTGGNTQVFSLTVTDNLGTTSSADTVSIQVDAPVVAATWQHHVAIKADRNGANTHTISPSAGTVGAGAIFTPTVNKLLVCVVYGAVTTSTPTGWTLVTSAVNNGGMYIFRKIAVGADTFSATHSADDYPVMFDWYEFPIQSVVTSSATQVSVNNGTAGASLSGLTGTNTLLAITGQVNTTGATPTISWNVGSEIVDVNVGAVATPGYVYGVTALPGSALTTWVATATSGNVSGQERTAVAVRIGSDVLNVAPVANAGPDQTGVAAGATVTLTGAASTDSDGTIVTYTWTQTAGTTVALSGTGATRTFTAPTGAAQTLTFSLVVTDDDGAVDSTPDTVNIGVLFGNSAPIANAGPDQIGVEPYKVTTLTAAASTDTDGIASYVWTQTSGPTVTLAGTGATRTFTTPGALGGATLVFSVAVTDTLGATSSDTVTVSVAAPTEYVALGGVWVPYRTSQL